MAATRRRRERPVAIRRAEIGREGLRLREVGGRVRALLGNEVSGHLHIVVDLSLIHISEPTRPY